MNAEVMTMPSSNTTSSIIHQPNEKGYYPPIIPDIKAWPIHQLTLDKTVFEAQLVAQSVERMRQVTKDANDLHQEMAKALYSERMRLKNEVWKVDNVKEEKAFWNKVNDILVNSSLQQTNQEQTKEEAVAFEKIITRYAQEIMGNFNPTTYRLASKVLPFAFSRLLNAASSERMFKILRGQQNLNDRIVFSGAIAPLRELATKGTIVLVPTHFSNLDSILIGWSLYVLGLPAFLYGAGLNLFNNSFLAYLMNRLGAYKIDRRKRNKLYVETLKTYSRLSIQRGGHTLFFPGGTRSRSGQLESKLKLGLLSSIVEAQQHHFTNQQEQEGGKIFIVPLVLSYHFVLEAKSLIEEHLKRSGKERYYFEQGEFNDWSNFNSFLWKFFGAKSKVHLSFGQPMDVLGNPVNQQGESLNQFGEIIDISAHFNSNGAFEEDQKRYSAYTKQLADAIVSAYYKCNLVLSSHLVAFVAFELLKKRNQRLDLYDFLRLPKESIVIPYQRFVLAVEQVLTQLKELNEAGNIQLADEVQKEIADLIEYGLRNVGVYHTQKPLLINEEGEVTSENLKLLYYYHNRLMGYGLEAYISN